MILTGPFQHEIFYDSNQVMAVFASRNNPAAEMGAAWKFRLSCAGCDFPDGATQ